MAEIEEQHSLVRNGIVSEGVYSRAEKLAKLRGQSVELTLNQMGALTDDRLVHYWKEITGLGVSDNDVSDQALSRRLELNSDFLRHHFVFPLGVRDEAFIVGMVDPTNTAAIRGLKFALQCEIEIRILPAGVWRKLWLTHIDPQHQVSSETVDAENNDLAIQERNAPVARKLTAWIESAADIGASDIHFEAKAFGLEVIYRVDGRLQTVAHEPRELAPSILSRLKVISGLDLGIKARPQDGRTSLVLQGRKLDVRVSVLPSIHGESAVLRLLDKPSGMLDFDALGFSQKEQAKLRTILQHRDGLFLVAGPTGSGKTTTLYACIEALKGSGLKILSVEDPVEYQFDHVTQVQVAEKTGLDFAGTLRAFLRHDPEVILVGEIRDAETANIAVQAAFTGHLVMASIHAIDTETISARLENMGVERFKIDACLRGSVSQRLVPKLCSGCREPRLVSSSESQVFLRYGLTAPGNLYDAVGCSECDHSGAAGRMLVCEIDDADTVRDSSLVVNALRLAASGDISFGIPAGLVS